MTANNLADAQDLFERGVMNLQSGDYREAVECFTRAIRLRPEIAAGYRYRAMALAKLGRRTDALNDLDQAVCRKPDDALLYAERADLLFRQKAFEMAVADCDKALSLDPGLAPIYGLRGECRAAQGATEAGLADLAMAIARDPGKAAEYRIARASLYLDLENYHSCIIDCDAALALSPENFIGYQVRGLANREIGDLVAAENDFSMALNCNPDLIPARLARATVRLGCGTHTQAIADCNYLVHLAPSLSKAYEIRGMAWRELGDHEAAMVDFTEATIRSPRDPLPYNLRAGLHYASGRYANAIQDHLEALKRNPHDGPTFNQLGWVWATAPDPDVRDGFRAKECATRACELVEWQEPLFLDTLAAAYAECGEFDDAVKWQQKTLEIAPPEQSEGYQTRLQLYAAGKPFRDRTGVTTHSATN